MKPVLSKSNIVGATCNFLSQSSIPHSRQYVQDFLKDHKDYPSLSAVSALLDDFNIENLPVRITIDQLTEMPVPAIAYCDDAERGGNFIVINAPVSGGQISYIDSAIGIVKEPLEEFKSKWQGVLLLGQVNEYSQSKENTERIHRQKRKQIHTAIIIPLLALTFASLFYFPGFSSIYALLIIVKVIGAGASLLLLAKELGMNSKFSDSICNMGGISQAVGCEKVSGSKAATIFGLFRMSEIGALYFMGSINFLTIALISGAVTNVLPFMFVVTILASPYTLFSLYYQVRVVKQICPLCLIVIMVIWADLIIMTLAGISISIVINAFVIATAIISFSIPVTFWLSVKHHVTRGTQSTFLKNKLRYFTSSPRALDAILQERKISFKGKLFNKIIINSNQETTVTAVLSLFCGSCSVAFKEICITASRYEFIQFNIILFPDDSGSNQMLRNLLNRKLTSGDASALEFLKHWYEHTIESLPATSNQDMSDRTIQKVEDIIAEWSVWLRNNNVSSTPRIYINDTMKPLGMSLSEFEPLFRSLRKLQSEIA